jgi:hypothetical protein
VADRNDDPTEERREGPTPNGGVASVAYYRDAAGNPAPKSRAAAVEVVELGRSGDAVHRTHARLRPET